MYAMRPCLGCGTPGRYRKPKAPYCAGCAPQLRRTYATPADRLEPCPDCDGGRMYPGSPRCGSCAAVRKALKRAGVLLVDRVAA